MTRIAYLLKSSAYSLLVLSTGFFCATQAEANDLAWNAGAGSFTGSDTWSYNDDGSIATTDNPFTLPGAESGIPGANVARIGNDGDVTLNTNTGGNAILKLHLGTNSPAANFSEIDGPDLRGNGTLTVTGSTPLLLADPELDATGGELWIGEQAGIAGEPVVGTLNWNSTGTLEAQGRIWVGFGGTGTFNQNDGKVISGNVQGFPKFFGVGQLGGTGTYNLNHGVVEVGAEHDPLIGEESRRLLRIGLDDNSTGVFNLGDGDGSAGSAFLESWDEVNVGDAGNGASGTMNVFSDGHLRINAPLGPSMDERTGLFIGSGFGSTGLLNQEGGTVEADGPIQVSIEGSAGTYRLVGSEGSASARSLTVNTEGTLDFVLDSNGVTSIDLVGSAAPGFNTSSGINLNSASSMLLVDMNSYTSDDDVVLVNSLDATAMTTGTFSNFGQGDVVGTNANGTQFYLNYFGGSNSNDILLQNTLPNSSTVGLVWNVGTANFDSGFFRSDGNFGAEPSPSDPFGPASDPGSEELFLGNGGTATLDDSTDTTNGSTAKSLEIGTTRAASRVAGTNGNGTLNASGSVDLTLTDVVPGSTAGNLTVGSMGTTGTLNWDSSGTLAAEGKFKVGQSGVGIVNQSDGLVTGGHTPGAEEFIAIGEGEGGNGTYNLAGGTLRPGAGDGETTRLLRVGYSGATGELNVGDGSGSTATIFAQNDLEVGTAAGGIGTMTIHSDGVVELDGQDAVMVVGILGGTGTVNQLGGSVLSDALFVVGGFGAGQGTYTISGGSLTTTVDGEFDEFRIGANTGNGTLRVEGTGEVSVDAGDLVLAFLDGTETTGRLELAGSEANMSVGRLQNSVGPTNQETIRWEADANGVTPLEITGNTAVEEPADFVQLQDPVEISFNEGTEGLGDLMGNGIALELDLSALSGDQTLTLIDNQTEEDVLGRFERGNTRDLYEEGEAILGTGFLGDVTISYFGGDGNDVILDLLAGAGLAGDFDNDGDVDGSDFLLWQRGESPNPMSSSDLADWQANYGTMPNPVSTQAVPEPTAVVLALAAGLSMLFRRPSHS